MRHETIEMICAHVLGIRMMRSLGRLLSTLTIMTCSSSATQGLFPVGELILALHNS